MWLRRSSHNGVKVLEANATWEATERVNCCSHFSFDLETPVKENNPFPVLTGYFISRKHACYFIRGNCLGCGEWFVTCEQRHLLVVESNRHLLREEIPLFCGCV